MPQVNLTAETGTNGSNVTTSNGWAAVSPGTGGTITFSNAQAAHGSLSYKLTKASGVTCYVMAETATTSTNFSTRFYLYLTGYPSTEQVLDAVYTAAGVMLCRINLTITGTIRTVSAASASLGLMTTAIPLNQWVRLSLFGTSHATTGTVNARLYTSPDSVTVTEQLAHTNVNTNGGAAARTILGAFVGTGTQADFYLDDVAHNMETATEIGPAVSNVPPTANAGPDQSATVGVLVNLTGTGSSDSDGTIASYAWSWSSRPGGSTAAFSSTTSATPTFTPDVAGAYVASLTVTDNGGATSSPDTVTITASAPPATPVTRFGTSGAGATNTATFNTLPASIPAGALMVLKVTSDSASIPTTFSGWTLRTSGVVSGGSMNGVIYTKVAAGTEGGTNVSMTGITGGTKGVSVIDVWTVAGGQSFSIATNSGADTDSTSTAFSAAGASWTTLADDAIDSLGVMLTTGAFSGNSTGPTLTQSGATHTTTARFAGTTASSTIAYNSLDAQVTTGSTGSPVLAATTNTTGANATGLALFTRLRSVSNTVDAGPDQGNVEPWAQTVTLSGASSNGSYAWTQTAGTTVTLSSTTTAAPTFTAPPGLIAGETLTFQLSNGAGQTDTVNVTILPATTFVKLANGTLSPRRIWMTTAAPAGPEQVGWIGDSLTYQNNNTATGPSVIQAQLVANGWDSTSRVDGLVGRSIINGEAPWIPSSQDVIDTWRAAGFNPRTWVFALVTNDEWETNNGWTTKVNTLLNKVTSVPHASGLPYRIFWVGGPVYRPDIQATSPYDTRATRFASVLASVAAARPEFQTFVHIDVTSAIHNGRDETGLWLSSDDTGRHMTTAGYELRNTLTVPLVALP